MQNTHPIEIIELLEFIRDVATHGGGNSYCHVRLDDTPKHLLGEWDIHRQGPRKEFAALAYVVSRGLGEYASVEYLDDVVSLTPAGLEVLNGLNDPQDAPPATSGLSLDDTEMAILQVLRRNGPPE